MDLFLIILFGILVILFVVTIHEFGHYFAARLFKVEVTVFSIGWGPRLFSFYRGGTEWRLALFPIGGMCKMRGEEDFISALEKNDEYIKPSPGSFYNTKPWQRIIISFAGPFFNLVSALILFAFLYMPEKVTYEPTAQIILLKDLQQIEGKTIPNDNPLYGVNSPAVKAGLQTGDEITKINGKSITYFSDLIEIIYQSPDTELEMVVQRGDAQILLKITPYFNKNSAIGQIGVAPLQEPRIREIKPGSEKWGFNIDDLIVEIDGKKITTVNEFDQAINKKSGVINFIVDRNGTNIPIQAIVEERFGRSDLRLEFDGKLHREKGKNFFQAFAYGTEQSVQILASMFRIFDFIGKGTELTTIVSGPVRNIETIGSRIGYSLQDGFEATISTFASLSALISIALFFGNLLPIPALDGGQILLSLIEAIKRRPLKLKTIKIYNAIGFVMVIFLLAVALIGDFTSRT